jgi:hypothetical protein
MAGGIHSNEKMEHRVSLLGALRVTPRGNMSE